MRLGIVGASPAKDKLRAINLFLFSCKFASYICCTALLALALSNYCLAQATGFDLDNKTVDPLSSNPGHAVVMIFVREDCPVSGRYAATIQNLSQKYQAAHFYLIFPDASRRSEDIRKYLIDFHYSLPALRDPGHALVKQAQVEITPEGAIFQLQGRFGLPWSY